MAANFPNSPNTNDTFTSNGVTFFWNGEAWKQPASPGVKGTKGDTGTKGEKGQKGDRGDKGQKGEIGLSGNPGGEGDKGDKGQKGEGQKGQKGQDGNDGTGIKGNKGESGTSVKGQKGDDNSTKGEKGQKGVDGDDGTSVKGQKGQKGDDNSTKGQKGDVGTTTKGQKGEPGADNSTKGQKGEQGSSGSATISNNADNRVITGGTGTNLNAEQNLTFDGSTLNVSGSGTPTIESASELDITATTATFSGTASFAGGHPTSNFYSGADDLVVANFTQDTGISIMSGTSNEANIAFGSTTFGTGAIAARLYYDSGDDKLIMNTLTTGHDIEIKSAGTITLGDLNNPTITIDDMTASGSNYGVEVDGTIYPKITGAAHSYRDLGLSGVRWTNVYATNLHGDGSNITNITGGVPTGTIVMYNGDAAPSGWALCDGQNGTPDLRDRFIVGSGNSYNRGATGGAASVTLSTSQLPAHTHGDGSLSASNTSLTGSITGISESFAGFGGSASGVFSKVGGYNLGGTPGSPDANNTGGVNFNGGHSHDVTGSTGSTGSGSSHENRPPYYALTYIIKL